MVVVVSSGQVPTVPQTGTCPRPGGLGPLLSFTHLAQAEFGIYAFQDPDVILDWARLFYIYMKMQEINYYHNNLWRLSVFVADVIEEKMPF